MRTRVAIVAVLLALIASPVLAHHRPNHAKGPKPTPTASPTPTPTLAPTPTPTPTDDMPVGDLPGWRQIFTDDFTTDIPLGGFPSQTNGRWWAYPYPWQSTFDNGWYYPERVVSVHDGMLDKYLHIENGQPLVAAILPNINGSSGRDQLYGRYAVRFRADPVAGYKLAWLLWPQSETWPRDGEIDFPEGGLNGNICAFMHRQGATSGSDQDAYCTSTTFTDWHTAVIEWAPGDVKFILDGTVIGHSTSRVPNTPMHWVLQTETTSSGPSGSGHVYIDWVAAYAYAP